MAWLWLWSINIWYTKLGRFSPGLKGVLLIFEMEKFGPFLRKGGFTNWSYQKISALKVVLLIQYSWKEINFRKIKFSQSKMNGKYEFSHFWHLCIPPFQKSVKLSCKLLGKNHPNFFCSILILQKRIHANVYCLLVVQFNLVSKTMKPWLSRLDWTLIRQ